jgi:hypothetical protein
MHVLEMDRKLHYISRVLWAMTSLRCCFWRQMIMRESLLSLSSHVQAGADPDACAVEGHTPLVCAVAVGAHHTIEVLIAAGADPYAACVSGVLLP